ncbi:metal-dependent phosphohydrolase [Microbispora sp. H11081]|uniref:HD domain-containing protein n=1 Tax=Microbispora sp. H11081 TaxID=2729107 RepID=UPI00201618FB|nr:metal-dependent phosphohydrolase [Microbispora sp. H11081]
MTDEARHFERSPDDRNLDDRSPDDRSLPRPGCLTDSPGGRALAAELAARWAEPHRRYHTTAHLRAVLAAIEPLAALAEDADAVRLAAWFHDAVYDGRPGWDEERGAQLAQARLPACGLPAARVREVARLVRLTAGHTYDPGDANAAVLCDADLAILAAPPGAYEAYTRAVREEYRHVPDDAFVAGRAAVLRGLLGKPRLFGTPVGRELWERRARENLAAELARLRSGARASAFTM